MTTDMEETGEGQIPIQLVGFDSDEVIGATFCALAAVTWAAGIVAAVVAVGLLAAGSEAWTVTLAVAGGAAFIGTLFHRIGTYVLGES